MSFLELISLKKRFGGVQAVDDVSLQLKKGSLTALVGPNGCGKSTLFNLITGTFPADSGQVILGGEEITNLPAHKIARKGIGRKFQVPTLFPELTVRENLSVPKLQNTFFSRQHNADDEIVDVLSKINLTHKADQPAETLAHGEKQWLEIGMILVQSPSLILLDEPTAGMTALETAATAELIKDINRTNNITVLVIEHDIGFIEQLQCPLTVMSNGSVLKSGTFQSIRNDREVQELYFGRTIEDAHA